MKRNDEEIKEYYSDLIVIGERFGARRFVLEFTGDLMSEIEDEIIMSGKDNWTREEVMAEIYKVAQNNFDVFNNR